MGVVQGTSHPEHVVMDAELVSGHLLPPGSVYAFLAEHRGELFPDAMFADLFPSSLGRPSVPADVVASVLLLQALEGRSDREAVEALTFDLRWKAACGLPIAAAGFHPTVLTYWRRRLSASARPNRIFDAVREVVAATGALSGKTRRVLDSTVLTDAVATQDTVTQLIAAIRRVRREVPGAAEVVAIATALTAPSWWPSSAMSAGLSRRVVRCGTGPGSGRSFKRLRRASARHSCPSSPAPTHSCCNGYAAW
jgi:hypothetical protein